MKYLIWGAGVRGARILPHIGPDMVEAYIDVDKDKVGKEYLGKKIISFNEYLEEFKECYIIISCQHEQEIIDILEEKKVYRYFLLTDCPGEWQEQNIRRLLKEYIEKIIVKKSRYAIYGITLFGLILNDWIEEVTGERAVLIRHNDLNSEQYACLKEDCSKDIYIELDNIREYNIGHILVTYEKEMKIVEQKLGTDYSIKNVFDCSDNILEYYNPQIEVFKNMHIGKRCFIVATGPSIRMEDLETLQANNEICISMNSIWRAFDKVNWRPRYYVAEDFRVYKEYGDVIEDLEAEYLFLSDTDKNYWVEPHERNKLKFHLVCEYSEKEEPKFTEHFEQKSYSGSTVTYSCIQLAVYMGFREIYLYGVDFTHGKDAVDKKYHHFYNEVEMKSVGYNKRVFLAYESAKKYADNHGIKIYNTTKGGNLEVFERINFDTLF